MIHLLHLMKSRFLKKKILKFVDSVLEKNYNSIIYSCTSSDAMSMEV